MLLFHLKKREIRIKIIIFWENLLCLKIKKIMIMILIISMYFQVKIYSEMIVIIRIFHVNLIIFIKIFLIAVFLAN